VRGAVGCLAPGAHDGVIWGQSFTELSARVDPGSQKGIALSETESSPPPIELSSAFLRELVALWRDSAGEDREVQVLDGSPIRAVSALAHADHAVALTEAVLLLAEHGMLVQAVPLVRLTVECGISAAWWSVTPHSGEAANHEAARLRLALVTDMAKLAGPVAAADAQESIADVRKMVAELKAYESLEAGKFVDRVGSLAGANWVYAYYRLLSAFSHAGALLLDHYVQLAPNTSLGWAYKTDPVFEHVETLLALQPIALLLGMKAADDLTIGHPRRTPLDEIATRMGTEAVIRRQDTPLRG